MGSKLSVVAMLALLLQAGCAHDEATRSGASQSPPTTNAFSDEYEQKPSSDFSPEYRQQMENAQREAEQKKRANKKRDKRVDDIINRSDRRE